MVLKLHKHGNDTEKTDIGNYSVSTNGYNIRLCTGELAYVSFEMDEDAFDIFGRKLKAPRAHLGVHVQTKDWDHSIIDISQRFERLCFLPFDKASILMAINIMSPTRYTAVEII